MRLTTYLIMDAALWACALSTGAKAYYVAAIAMAAVMLLSLISVIWALLTVNVDMKGIRSRVERGESIMTVFSVRHMSLLPVSAVRLTLSSPASTGREVSVPAMPFSKKTFRQKIYCPHRGVYKAGVTKISVTDLFGLISLSRKSDMSLVRMEVAPRARKDTPMELKTGDIGPESISRASDDTAAPSDVRKWEDGDPLKRVHWKLSMRKRELMVRVFEESARPDTLIIPDLTPINAAPDQAMTYEDMVCEACAGAAKAQLEAGYPVAMPLTGAQPTEISGQFPADTALFTDALMKVTFDSPYAYEQVLTLMMNRLSRTGGVVIATPYLTSRIADMAVRMQLSGVSVRVIWITDTRLDKTLEMCERLRMQNVRVDRLDPWIDSEDAV